MVIAFFGAEELGLHGSRALVKAWDFQRRPITAMVNVDMIGRPLVDQPMFWLGARVFGILDEVDPETAVGALIPDAPPAGFEQQVRAACASQGVRLVLPKDLPPSLGAKVEAMVKGRSDHAPFEDKKVPFVFFSSGESSDYHEPTDTPDRLHPRVLVTPGLRADMFYSNGESAMSVDPRLALVVQAHPRVRLLHAFGMAHQRQKWKNKFTLQILLQRLLPSQMDRKKEKGN